MELYTNNTDILRQQFKKLLKLLKTETDYDKIIRLFIDIGELNNLYVCLNRVQIKVDSSKNKLFSDYQKEKRQLLKDNFIKNKTFHREFTSDILDELYDILDQPDFKEENLKISDHTKYKIMFNFLKDKKLEYLLEDTINNRKIFSDFSAVDLAGATFFNKTFSDYYVFIENDLNDAEKMATIIHELGHLYDSSDLSKNIKLADINAYMYVSIYNEVNSLMFEKEFLNYILTKCNLEDSCSLIKYYYLSSIENILKLKLITNFDNNEIIDESYKKVNRKKIQDYLDQDPQLQDFSFYDCNYKLELCENLKYGYGGILANYYAHLSRVDKEKYNYYYSIFLKNRYKPFDPTLMMQFIESKDKVIEANLLEINRDYDIIENYLIKQKTHSKKRCN